MAVDLESSLRWLPEDGPAEQLIVLLHGWASQARSLEPLALALRGQFPRAAVLAPQSELPADDGKRGRQWYSIAGLDAEVWPQRVAGVLPMLRDWVRAQQRQHGVGPAATALGGFSQGAILSLALALQDDGIAGRVLAFGGCLVQRPAAAPRHTTLHFFHGSEDTVIPAAAAREALQWLGMLHGDATLDIAEGVGHELHPALIDCALHRLHSHIPLRTCQTAAVSDFVALSEPRTGHRLQ